MKFLASSCVCGQLNVEHALSCPRESFLTLCHNEVRDDIRASYLTEVLSNVTIELHLQPLYGEQLQWSSSNSDDSAHLDIAVDGFWSSSSRAFFDVRVFTQLNSNTSASAVYHHHEQETLQAYGQHVHEVEHGSFTPLVFSALCEKWDIPYSIVLCLLRCRLSFALLRSAIQCW